MNNLHWSKNLPDSPGNWLWLMQWECQCCIHHAGISWVTDEEHSNPNMMIRLSNGLLFSWENQKPYDYSQLEDITAWCKIEIPYFKE